MISVTLSTITQGQLIILMKKEGNFDNGTSGVQKYLQKLINDKFEALNLPKGTY